MFSRRTFHSFTAGCNLFLELGSYAAWHETFPREEFFFSVLGSTYFYFTFLMSFGVSWWQGKARFGWRYYWKNFCQTYKIFPVETCQFHMAQGQFTEYIWPQQWLASFCLIPCYVSFCITSRRKIPWPNTCCPHCEQWLTVNSELAEHSFNVQINLE